MTETMKALAKQMLNWADAERATRAVIVIAFEKIDDKKADGILSIGGTDENLVIGLKAALKRGVRPQGSPRRGREAAHHRRSPRPLR